MCVCVCVCVCMCVRVCNVCVYRYARARVCVQYSYPPPANLIYVIMVNNKIHITITLPEVYLYSDCFTQNMCNHETK